ncbi:MAG: [FeFe] hydrogenase H-cluster radical SAM maturase HydE [Clostridiales bacterium]|jgi:biotin synthase|nr:[FeFe] hydrogenase H-cluster radical SAM maturase HydE [Clostridiales bacterium]
MDKKYLELIEKLEKVNSLSLAEYEAIISCYQNSNEKIQQKLREYAAQKARSVANKVYGNKIFIRGLMEISNYCKNDCLYCGIRKSNKEVKRYRLSKEDILSACEIGYALGFRTFVLQGGDDPYYTDEILVDIVLSIKNIYPDCAVTLSLGEKSKTSLQKLRDAGADRYLLRHETADSCHYAKLHPENMLLSSRIECLYMLKEIGYQAGCGFMVGSPYQTPKTIAKDLKFIEEFKPAMCGIGPFIPHHNTPFKDMEKGDTKFTCFLLSLIRLIVPNVLLPATTALASLDNNGREEGILSGANVIMPNLSPAAYRKNYEIYDNKAYQDEEAAESIELLKDRMKKIGYEISISRGDVKTIY